MRRTLNRLKPLTVEKAKAPGRYADCGGLYLAVKPGPRRSWVFLYRKAGNATELGLSSVKDASLISAREKAAELRKVQGQAQQDARAISFEYSARRYHERHKVKWHSEQYARDWLRGLEIHVFPGIGKLSVRDVDIAAVLKVIEPIWHIKPRVAQLIRANIESVLDLARAEGHRTTNNPARWELLRHSLPARKGARAAGHFRALAYSDMPTLLKDLEKQNAISALWSALHYPDGGPDQAACRWPDIDMAARTRAVQILKGGGAWQHLVPLSEQAIKLLRGLMVDSKPAGEHVFPARNRRGRPGTSAMLDLLERMGWSDRTTTHGIRAAFKTWATERTNYAREVVELCLSHVQGDALDRAYQRGDILDKRRRLMQEWADFCEHGDQQSDTNVVPLRA